MNFETWYRLKLFSARCSATEIFDLRSVAFKAHDYDFGGALRENFYVTWHRDEIVIAALCWWWEEIMSERNGREMSPYDYYRGTFNLAKPRDGDLLNGMWR